MSQAPISEQGEISCLQMQQRFQTLRELSGREHVAVVAVQTYFLKFSHNSEHYLKSWYTQYQPNFKADFRKLQGL
jgi:hypothetical protein